MSQIAKKKPSISTVIPHRRLLGVFTLSMINVAAIISLKTLPIIAEYGLALIFFTIMASIIFFLPVSLVSAELATGWPKAGGVYIWIRAAMGSKFAFIAIWLQWIENVIWYPAVLAFAAGTISYVFFPELTTNRIYIVLFTLGSFWLITFINFFGIKASGIISSFGVISGTIIPGIVIIILGIIWLCLKNPTPVTFTFDKFFPNFTNFNNYIFLAGILLGLSGMEMPAVHAHEVINPQKNYPKAILLSTIIILILCIFGSLGLVVVIPHKEMNLVTGIMAAFTYFFDAFHVKWLASVIAILTAIGALSMISTWTIGPSKGLLITAHYGDLPKIFQKVNKKGVPISLLILQAVIITILCMVFLVMPTINSAYWILTALASKLYLLMYILLFISAIRLRYKQPKVPRAFKIPFKNVGMWVVAGLGGISSIFALIIGFLPPPNMDTGSIAFYEGFLIIGTIFITIVPILVLGLRTKDWKPTPPFKDQKV